MSTSWNKRGPQRVTFPRTDFPTTLSSPRGVYQTRNVRSHAWFAHLDWDVLLRKEFTPVPGLREIRSSEDCLRGYLPKNRVFGFQHFMYT